MIHALEEHQRCMPHRGLRKHALAMQAFSKAERLRTSSQDSGRPLAASSRPSYDGSEASDSQSSSEGTSADGQECAPSSRAASVRLPFAPKRRSVQVLFLTRSFCTTFLCSQKRA